MFSVVNEVDLRSPGARSERIRFKEELNESGGDGREAELMELRDGGHDFVGKLLKIFPVFWVSGKPHRGAVDHSDRSEGVPPSISGHSFPAADDVDGNDGNVRPRSDQSDARFGFGKISVERPASFGEEDKGSFVLQDLKNIFEGGRPG